jgi:hypothetical protein
VEVGVVIRELRSRGANQETISGLLYLDTNPLALSIDSLESVQSLLEKLDYRMPAILRHTKSYAFHAGVFVGIYKHLSLYAHCGSDWALLCKAYDVYVAFCESGCVLDINDCFAATRYLSATDEMDELKWGT